MPPQPRRRRSLRLPGYDYTSPGAYFITAVTRHREPLFGEVVNGVMRLNAFGEIVWACWRDLPNHYPHVQLDVFVVMPNHIHGIIVLVDDGGGRGGSETHPYRHYRHHGLPEIMRALKSFSARRINALRGTPGQPVWQRSYYKHIIRDEGALRRIRNYILTNPLRWENDRDNR